MTFNGNQTIAGNGTLALVSYNNSGGFEALNGILTVAAGVTVTGNAGYVGDSAFTGTTGTINNYGTISNPGGTNMSPLYIAPTNFTNYGTVSTTNNGTIELDGNWTNHGTFVIGDSGTLNLTGNFTVASIGVVQNTNGSLNFRGTLNNTGTTFAINAQTGNVGLRNGEIDNGTLTATGGYALYVSYGTLNNVTIGPSTAASVVVNDQGTLLAPAGLNLAGGIVSCNGFSSPGTITLGGTNPLSGSGQILFPGFGTVAQSAGLTLTIPSAVSVHAAGNGGQDFRATLGAAGSPLVNNGLISAENIFHSLTVAGSTVSNFGTIQSVNGLLNITGALTNDGTVIVNNGTLDLNISNFSTALLTTIRRTGGEVNLTSSYDNTGRTIALTAATGSLGLTETGSITGGTISATGGAQFYVPGPFNSNAQATLSGVTFAANVTVEDQGDVNVTNGLTLQNSTLTLGTHTVPLTYAGGIGTFLQFSGANSVLGGTGTVLFETTTSSQQIAPNYNTTLVIGPGITVRTDTGGGTIGSSTYFGSPTVVEAVDNKGTISSQTPGQGLILIGSSILNEGAIQASNGGLLQIYFLDNRGSVSVRGSVLSLHGSVTNESVLSIDDGALFGSDANANGLAYTQTAAGTLDILLNSGSSGTALFNAAGATATLNGELEIELENGFSPTIGMQWTLLRASSVGGQFQQLQLPTLPNDWSFAVNYSSTTVTLSVVPEPAPTSVAAMGGCGLLIRRRRRSI